MEGIELIDLTLRSGNTVILDHINESIAGGEFYCLVGSSGSGKSSLIKAINGLVPYIEGEVIVGGDSIYKYTQAEMLNFHRRCGYVFQNAAMISGMSLMDNLSIGFKYHSEYSESQIEERILPELEYFDFNTNLLAKTPTFLSAGERMISCIIRAYLKKPDYFFWDEPFGSLDHIYQAKVKERLLESKRNKKTTILITNRVGLAMELADRIGILDKGKIIASDTPEEIQKSTNATVKKLLKL